MSLLEVSRIGRAAARGNSGQNPRLAAAVAISRLAFINAITPTRRNLLHWLSWALALAAVLAMTAALWNGAIFEWEKEVTREVQGLAIPTAAFEVSFLLTNSLAPPVAILVLAIAGLLVAYRHPGAATLLLLTFPIHVVSLFPKALVDRERPSAAFEGIEGIGGGQSFPSGHAEFVITFYGFLAYFLVLHVTRAWQRWAIVCSWLALAALTGLGRVAEGRHWPLDVMFGYVIGLGVLSGMVWLHTSLRRAKEAYAAEDALSQQGRPPDFARISLEVTALSTWQRPSMEAIERVLLTAIVCAFLMLLVIVDVAGPTAFDRWLAGQIQGIQWGGLDFLPALGSEVGGGMTGFFLVPLLVAGGFAIRRQWRLVVLIGAVYALHYLMISPKLFIPAERPSPLFGVEGAGGLESFPSGHVQWAVSFYGLLAFLAWQAAPKKWRWAIVPAYVAIVVFAALGRIELGRHWPVDTIAGILVGLLAVRILIGIYHHWARRGGPAGITSTDRLPLGPSSSPAP